MNFSKDVLGEVETMSNERRAGLGFQNLMWRRTVRTHLHNAFRTKPANVLLLKEILQKILDAGPLLHGCDHIVSNTKSTYVETNGGKVSFAAVPVDRLIAIVQWDRNWFTILAIIDLDRLARRNNRRRCNIVDCELCVEGRPITLAIFVDPQDRVVYMKEETEVILYDSTSVTPPPSPPGTPQIGAGVSS